MKHILAIMLLVIVVGSISSVYSQDDTSTLDDSVKEYINRVIEHSLPDNAILSDTFKEYPSLEIAGIVESVWITDIKSNDNMVILGFGIAKDQTVNVGINDEIQEFTFNINSGLFQERTYIIPLDRIQGLTLQMTSGDKSTEVITVLEPTLVSTEKPTITAIPDQTVTAGELIEFDVIATSENPNADFYFSISPETSITHTITFKGNTFSWIPTSDNVGTHTLTFIVQDLNNETSFMTQAVFTIQAPIEKEIVEKEQNIKTLDDRVKNSINIAIEHSQPDNTILSKTFTKYPSLEISGIVESVWITDIKSNDNMVILGFGIAKDQTVNVGINDEIQELTFNVNSGLFQERTLFIPLDRIQGLTLQMSSGDESTEVITLLESTPVSTEKPTITITAIPDQTVTVGNIVEFTVSASAPDNPVLTYSLTSAPENASIDSSTGVFTWTPIDKQIGTHRVSISVTDGAGNVATQTVTVKVSKAFTTITELPVSTLIFDLDYFEFVGFTNMTNYEVYDGTMIFNFTASSDLHTNGNLPVGTSGDFKWTAHTQKEKSGLTIDNQANFESKITIVKDYPYIEITPQTALGDKAERIFLHFGT